MSIFLEPHVAAAAGMALIALTIAVLSILKP